MKKIFLYLLVSGVFFAEQAISSAIDMHGFMTIGSVISDTNEKYNNEIKDSINYSYDTKFGLNFSSRLSNKWTVAMQLLNQYENEDEKFSLFADWFFIAYQPFENLFIRIGKIKVPIWLISDQYSVGFLYPWVRPPNELYGLIVQTTLKGASVNYKWELPYFNVGFDMYFGDSQESFRGGQQQIDLDAQPIGGNISFFNDNFLVRAMYFLDQRAYMKGASATYVPRSVYEFFGGGAKVEMMNMFLWSEYGHGTFSDYIGDTKIKKLVQKAFYITLGYENLWLFTPLVTYSQKNTEPYDSYRVLFRTDLNKVKDIGCGVNIKTSNASVIKLQYQRIYVDPYGDFNTLTEVDDPVNMYSMSFDMVF